MAKKTNEEKLQKHFDDANTIFDDYKRKTLVVLDLDDFFESLGYAGKMLLLVLLLTGCAWLTPAKEDTAALENGIAALHEALILEQEVLQTNLAVVEEGWSRAINGEAEQAMLDDMKALQIANAFTPEKISERRTVVETKREANLATMREILQTIRESQSAKDVREIESWLQSYWMSRLSFDAARTKVAGDAIAIGQKFRR